LQCYFKLTKNKTTTGEKKNPALLFKEMCHFEVLLIVVFVFNAKEEKMFFIRKKKKMVDIGKKKKMCHFELLLMSMLF